MTRITDGHVRESLNEICRVFHLTCETNNWAPGDRYGRRYTFAFSAPGVYGTTEVRACGASAAFAALRAFRAGLGLGLVAPRSEV